MGILVITTVTSHNDWLSKTTFFVQLRVSLCDNVLIFFIGCQPNDFVGHLHLFTVYFPVWRLDETIFVQVSVDDKLLIKPMFGPSGVSIGHIRP